MIQTSSENSNNCPLADITYILLCVFSQHHPKAVNRGKYGFLLGKNKFLAQIASSAHFFPEGNEIKFRIAVS